MCEKMICEAEGKETVRERKTHHTHRQCSHSGVSFTTSVTLHPLKHFNAPHSYIHIFAHIGYDAHEQTLKTTRKSSSPRCLGFSRASPNFEQTGEQLLVQQR